MSRPIEKYSRILGRVEHLQPGQWTEETASGRPAICCASCGGIADLPETHTAGEKGYVVPERECLYATCGVVELVQLVDYGEDILR